MDGNRRWARERGVSEAEGHAAGVDAIRPIVERAAERGVEVLSIYAFSRENWARGNDEVETLFALLDAAIRRETPDLVRQGVRGPPAGPAGRAARATTRVHRSRRRSRRDRRRHAHDPQRRLQLLGPLRDRGRRPALPSRTACPPTRSTRRPSRARLYTADLPELDLLIRTGGDQRISNFLLWQAAYAELYFCDVLWPDFDPADVRRGAGRVTPAAPAASAARLASAPSCSAAPDQRGRAGAGRARRVPARQPWLTLGVAVLAGVGGVRGGPARPRGRLAGSRRCAWSIVASVAIADARPGPWRHGARRCSRRRVRRLALVVVVAAWSAFRQPRRSGDGFLPGSGLVRRAVRRRCWRSSPGILASRRPYPPTAPLAGVLDAGRVWLLVLRADRVDVRQLRVPVAGRYHGGAGS